MDGSRLDWPIQPGILNDHLVDLPSGRMGPFQQLATSGPLQLPGYGNPSLGLDSLSAGTVPQVASFFQSGQSINFKLPAIPVGANEQALSSNISIVPDTVTGFSQFNSDNIFGEPTSSIASAFSQTQGAAFQSIQMNSRFDKPIDLAQSDVKIPQVASLKANDDRHIKDELVIEKTADNISTDVSVPQSFQTVIGGSTAAVIPSDGLFSFQWHLQNNTHAGNDLNVTGVWDEYTGRGVVVGVFDQGVQNDHPDLGPNYRDDLDWDVYDNDTDAGPSRASDNHGTAVAGMVTGQIDGVGSVGVAPDAEVTSYRGNLRLNSMEYHIDDAFRQALSNDVDVLNNSWGMGVSSSYYFYDDFDDPLFSQSGSDLQALAELGRDGLGMSVVFSAGNGASHDDNVNYHNFQNSPYGIAVGATTISGTASDFTTPGAAVLVSAPGTSVVTTDRSGDDGYVPGDYVSISGTSFSAPAVAGVVALMYEANGDLGYRDVQEILAYSSTSDPLVGGSWFTNDAINWNGGGLTYSDQFGFGLADAHAAVRLAETWTAQSTFANQTSVSASTTLNTSIVDYQTVSQTVTIAQGIEIDHVTVDLDLKHTDIGDLTITLTSPDGTVSKFVDTPLSSVANIDFEFSSVQFWGEDGIGDWTLSVNDNTGGNTGYIDDWTLTLWGDAINNDDVYIFTEEWADFGAQGDRGLLSDAAGIDTLNFAPLSGAITFDLASGTSNTLLGQTLTIDANSDFENIIGGDGGDTFTGTFAGNKLSGMRGDDWLVGGAGNDTLVGGVGADTLDGGLDWDIARFFGNFADYTVNDVGDGSGTVLHNSTGDTDTLSGIELLSFDDQDFAFIDPNNAPVAVTTAISGLEDTGASGMLVATDDEGNALTFSLDPSSVPGLGSISISSNGAYVFDSQGAFETMSAGEVQNLTFRYTVTDGLSVTAQDVILSIVGENDGPAANADAVSLRSDATVTVDVLANDTDVDTNDTLTISTASVSNGLGTASIVDNKIVYDPGSNYDGLAPDENASVEVTYTISDGNGGSSTSTVSVSVRSAAANEAPVLSNSLEDIGPYLADEEFLVSANNLSEQEGASVIGLSDGGFMVAWHSFDPAIGDPDTGGVAAQIYDSVGEPVGGEILVNSNMASFQGLPDIASLSNGNVVVTWASRDPSLGGGDGGVAAQIFDTSGNKVGGEFQVNTHEAGDLTSSRGESSVTALDGGGFVVSWLSNDSSTGDTSGKGVVAQRFADDGTKIGSEFRLNTDTGGNQEDAEISALTGGGFVATWETSGDIKAQIFDSSGNLVGGEFNVQPASPGYESNPVITGLTDGGFVAVWKAGAITGFREDGIYGQRFDASGDKVGSDFAIATGASQVRSADIVAQADGGFVVSWTFQGIVDGVSKGVAAQRYDAKSDPIGDSFVINTEIENSQANQSIAVLSNGDLVTAWNSRDPDWGDASGGNLVARVLSPTPHYVDGGEPVRVAPGISITDGDDTELTSATVSISAGFAVGEDVLSFTSPAGSGLTAAYDATSGVLTISGEASHAAYEQALNSVVYSNTSNQPSEVARTIEVRVEDGQLNSPESNAYTVTVSVTDRENNAPITTPGSEVIQEDSSIDGVLSATDPDGHGLTFTLSQDPANGTATVQADGSFSYTPDADFSGTDSFFYTVDDGQGGVVQEEMQIDVTPVADTPTVTAELGEWALGQVEAPGEAEFQVNSVETGFQFRSNTTVLNDGSYVIAWESDSSDPGRPDISAQLYDANNNPVGSEFTISTSNTQSQSMPTIAATSDGGFVTAWSSNHDGSYRVYGQKFDSSGNAVGAETLLSPSGALAYRPEIASLDGGGFVAVWDRSDGSNNMNTYARIFDDQGAPVANEFLVNTFTPDSQYEPAVTGLVGGGFAVSWRTGGQFDGLDVMSQMFDASGNKVGTEERSNTFTSGNQREVTNADLTDGGYIVAWDSFNQDGSSNGVYAQRYDSNGQAVGAEIQVNSHVNGNQSTASLASLPNGGFIATWISSDDQDGDGYAIIGQRFDASNNRIGGEFVINSTTEGTQGLPNVESTNDGGFIASWISMDANSFGVFAKRFDSDANPVAQTTTVNAYEASLTISGLATDVDGSEAITFYTVAGLPDGAQLSAGTDNGDGSWSVLPSQIDGLTVNVLQGSATSFNLTVTATAAEALDPSATATASVVVPALINLAPSANDDIVSADENGAITIDVLANDTDPEGPENLSVDSVSVVSGAGAVSIVNNLVVWDPGAEYDGLSEGEAETVTLTYVMSDNDGTSSSASVTINITGSNDGPVASTLLLPAKEDLGVAGTLLASDVEGDDLTFSLVTAPSTGSITIQSDGEYSYDPAGAFETLGEGETQDLAFTYAVSDGIDTTQVNATITVTGANDAPTISILSDEVGGWSDEARVNTGTAYSQLNPAIAALEDGGYVVTWDGSSSPGDDSVQGISLQRYDVDGNPVGDEVGVNTVTSSSQYLSSVVGLTDGGYVVSWASAAEYGTQKLDVIGQRFDAAGNKMGSEFQLATAVQDDDSNVKLSVLSNGGFAATWSSKSHADTASGDYDILVRVFGSDGNPVGDDVLVNAEQNNYQLGPNITELADGKLLAVWQSKGISGFEGQDGIVSRILNANGTPLSAEQIIATPDLGANTRPDIVALPDGGSIITWNSPWDDNGNTRAGVAFQRLDENGDLVGQPHQIEARLHNTYDNPGVDILPDGGFVITWSGYSGGQVDVWAQKFDIQGNANGDAFQVNELTSLNQLSSDAAVLKNGDIAFTWSSLDPSSGDTDQSSIATRVYNNPDASAAEYVEGEDPVIITSGVRLADIDSATFAAATISITGNFNVGEDVLVASALAETGIAAEYDAATGVLSLTGEADLATYQSVLNSIAYENTSNDPNTDVREISFQVDDGSGAQNISGIVTASVSVSSSNGAPTPVTSTITALEDTGATGVLAATDTEGDTLSFSLVSGPLSGTMTINADGSYQFDTAGAFESLAVGESQDVEFTYAVSDGSATVEQVATITVNGQNDGPSIIDRSLTIDEEVSQFSAAIAGVGVTDPDGDFITVHSVTQGQFGVVEIASNLYSVSYRPTDGINDVLAQGETRIDTFTYTITDGNGGFDTGTFTVTITGLNDGPISVSLDNSDALENADGVIVGNLSVVDVDESDTHTFTVSDNRFEVVSGALKLKDGTSLDHETEPTVNIVVTATDSAGASVIESFDISVGDVNEGPQLGADTVDAVENTPQLIEISALLSNDTDPDGDTFSFVGVSNAVGGSVSVVGDQVVFVPDFGFQGAASFTYTVTDGAITSEGSVNVTVEGVSVSLAGSADDEALSGGIGNDTLAGAAGNDTLSGASGNDTYQYSLGDGDDVIVDTAGNDQLVLLSNALGGVIAANRAGDDLVIEFDDGGSLTLTDQMTSDVLEKLTDQQTDDDGTVTATISRVIATGATGTNASEFITGTTGDDTLDGGRGHDAVYGGAGNDVLNGGSGADIIVGGTGDDTLDGGTSNDQYIYRLGDGTDIISDAHGSDRLQLSQKDLGAVTLSVRDGDDVVISFEDGGSIRIDDHYNGQAFETISGDASYRVSTRDDFLGGNGNDWISGTASDDTIVARGGDDIVFGGAGADVIDGGNGNNMVAGGAGADSFRVSALSGLTTISDFTASDGDQIDISSVVSGFDHTSDVADYVSLSVIDADGDGASDDLLLSVTKDGADADAVDVIQVLNVDTGTFDLATAVYGRGENTAPEAGGDDVVAQQDEPLVFDASTLLENDADPDGDPLSVTAVIAGENGSVTLENGEITFTPTAGFNGTASFTYTLSDDRGLTDTTTVEVIVEPTNFQEGNAIDGYIEGATIFADTNGNGLLDDGESWTTTGTDGYFKLADPVGDLVMVGGTDVSTGLEFDGVMRAPAGSSVVTPLTTLIAAVADNGMTTEAAATLVKTVLGIDSSVDLTTMDPVAATLSADAVEAAAGATVIAQGIAVQNTLVQMASAVVAENGANSGTAFQSVVDAFADHVTANGANTDLTDAGQMQAIVSAAAPGLDVAEASAVGSVAATSNASTVASYETHQPGWDMLAALAQSGLVAQGAAAAAIATAIGAGTSEALTAVADDYSGENLTAKVTAAADDIGDVDGATRGTTGNDRLNGTSGDDVIDGDDGADRINGRDGDDHLIGGEGNDTLQGQGGADQLRGGDGNDRLYADGDDIVVDGGDGYDRLYVRGEAGLNVDLAASELEEASGGAGDDIFDAANAADNVRLYGNAGNDVLTGGAGNDTLRGDDGDDNLVGGAGNDSLDGRDGADQISGGDGDDRLYVDGDDTLIDGGAGYDRLYARGDDGVSVDVADASIEEATGSLGNDTFDGGDATERVRLYGNTGDDVLTGGEGNDYLRGDDGNDVLSGGAGNDTLDGRAGADMLIGGAGDDRLYADADDSLITGGDGYDRLYIQGSEAVSLDLTTAEIEEAYGNIGDDTFDANASTENVRLYGKDGDDTLSGGAGNDHLRGDAGNDVLNGGDGNDILDGRDGADELRAGSGDDRLYADAADTVIDGGAGYDRLYVQGEDAVTIDLSAASIEEANGNAGDDVFDASNSTERVRLYGKDGDDVLSGGSGADHLRGDAGDDTLSGGAGNDTLEGRDGADQLDAGDGDDRLYVDSDDTLIDGGDGYDRLYVQGAGGVNLDLNAAGIEEAYGNAGNDLFNGSGMSERVRLFGNDGNDLLVGGTGHDYLRGDDGNDMLTGGDGNDTLDGRSGADALDGGAGDDRLYADADDTLIDGGEGYDRLYVTGTQGVEIDVSAASIEEAIGGAGDDVFDASAMSSRARLYGLAGDDELIGGTGNDYLRGDGGNDQLIGGDGDDTLDGRDDADELIGGAGNDRLYVDADDTVIDGGTGYDRVYVRGTEGVNLDLAVAAVEEASGGAGDDVFNASGMVDRANMFGQGGNDQLTGGDANDYLRGDTGNDQLIGGAGNDTLIGGGDADEISGGIGDDRLYVDAADTMIDGGDGFDRLYVQGSDGVSVDLGASSIEEAYGGIGDDQFDGSDLTERVRLYGNDGDDVLTGGSGNDYIRADDGNDTLNGNAGADTLEGRDGNDTLNGGADADRLFGGDGDDTLSGGDGDDLLKGGAGDDLLIGGAGYDKFNFDSLSGNDTIADFTVGEDTLALSHDLQIINLIQADIDDDGIDDVVVEFDNSVTATLLGISDDITEDDLFF